MFNSKIHRINLLRKGKCPNHPGEDIILGKKLCIKCINIKKEYRNMNKNQGKCPNHPKEDAVPGKIYCKLCRDYNKNKHEFSKFKKKCYNHQNIDAVSKTLCQECLDKKRKYRNNCNKEWENILRERGQDKCSKCGYNKSSIDFHHPNSKIKEFEIGILKLKKFKPEYLKELDKCIALCANCHRESRTIFHNNKYKRKYSLEWDNILKNRGQNKCSKCNHDNILSIDLHHKNTKKKEFTMAELRNYKFKPEYIKELNKCIALCANCHREVHNEISN